MTDESKPKERLTMAKLDAEIGDLQEFVQGELWKELGNIAVRLADLEEYKETRNAIDASMADQMTAIEKDTGEVAGALQDLVAGMMETGEETEVPEPRTMYAELETQEEPDDTTGYGVLVAACRGLHDILALAGMLRGDLDLSILQKEQFIRGACNAAGVECSPQLLQRAGA